MTYLDYYDLEQYLFSKVQPKFHRDGTIGASDFFCIIIWKANRAKSKIARKLLAIGNGKNLEDIVHKIASDIASAAGSKEKLRVLIEDWELRLAMATAILTVLYPRDFTVYDVRVCESLKNHKALGNKTNFERLWDGYQSFLSDVKAAGPAELSLREKDRWLWGKSFITDLSRDIESGFAKRGAAGS